MFPNIQTKKMNRQTSIVAGKLKNLTFNLQNANRAFRHIAGRCANQRAQLLVFGMATDLFQCYRELSLHAQVLKGETDFNENIFTGYQYDDDGTENMQSENMDKVLEDCSNIEHGLISEFKRLLNDALIAGDLRKMLQEQLNGFMYSFAKIKMLNSLHISSRDYVSMW